MAAPALQVATTTTAVSVVLGVGALKNWEQIDYVQTDPRNLPRSPVLNASNFLCQFSVPAHSGLNKNICQCCTHSCIFVTWYIAILIHREGSVEHLPFVAHQFFIWPAAYIHTTSANSRWIFCLYLPLKMYSCQN